MLPQRTRSAPSPAAPPTWSVRSLATVAAVTVPALAIAGAFVWGGRVLPDAVRPVQAAPASTPAGDAATDKTPRPRLFLTAGKPDDFRGALSGAPARATFATNPPTGHPEAGSLLFAATGLDSAGLDLVVTDGPVSRLAAAVASDDRKDRPDLMQVVTDLASADWLLAWKRLPPEVDVGLRRSVAALAGELADPKGRRPAAPEFLKSVPGGADAWTALALEMCAELLPAHPKSAEWVFLAGAALAKVAPPRLPAPDAKVPALVEVSPARLAPHLVHEWLRSRRRADAPADKDLLNVVLSLARRSTPYDSVRNARTLWGSPGGASGLTGPAGEGGPRGTAIFAWAAAAYARSEPAAAAELAWWHLQFGDMLESDHRPTGLSGEPALLTLQFASAMPAPRVPVLKSGPLPGFGFVVRDDAPSPAELYIALAETADDVRFEAFHQAFPVVRLRWRPTGAVRPPTPAKTEPKSEPKADPKPDPKSAPKTKTNPYAPADPKPGPKSEAPKTDAPKVEPKPETPKPAPAPAPRGDDAEVPASTPGSFLEAAAVDPADRAAPATPAPSDRPDPKPVEPTPAPKPLDPSEHRILRFAEYVRQPSAGGAASVEVLAVKSPVSVAPQYLLLRRSGPEQAARLDLRIPGDAFKVEDGRLVGSYDELGSAVALRLLSPALPADRKWDAKLTTDNDKGMPWRVIDTALPAGSEFRLLAYRFDVGNPTPVITPLLGGAGAEIQARGSTHWVFLSGEPVSFSSLNADFEGRCGCVREAPAVTSVQIIGGGRARSKMWTVETDGTLGVLQRGPATLEIETDGPAQKVAITWRKVGVRAPEVVMGEDLLPVRHAGETTTFTIPAGRQKVRMDY